MPFSRNYSARVLVATVVAFSPAFGIAVAADAYPSKPITMIIANPPGGDDDTLTRFLAEEIRGDLGQPIIVENRGGGATTIGAQVVASSDPDGYRILSLATSGLIQTQLRTNLPYSLDSFTPVAGIGGYPIALVVSPQSDVKTFQDLVAKARSAEGVTFASAGAGTVAHLTAVRFLKEIGGTGTHVAFKNNPDGLQSISGGYTEMMFPSAREASVLAADGRVRVLAVTSPQRTVNLPDVPTMTELGHPDIDSALWYGYMAPIGTPPAAVERLAAAIVRGVEGKAFQDRFAPLAFNANLMTGQTLRDFIDAQASRWRTVIQENGVQFTD